MSQGAFTADFLFNIEKRMRVINERGYMKMLDSENIWYPKLLRTVPLDGKSDRVIWLLTTASIEQVTANDGGESGGAINFDELATISQEYFPAMHRRGFKIGKMKYLNFLNGGIDPATKWAGDIGTYGAYYPQRLCTQVILNGGSILGYDGVNFFSTAHPVHPLIPALGTYANDFTGAASGSYPGALPIDDSVSTDVALVNLGKALAYIMGSIGQPNGAGDPRFLEPAFIIHPPRMTARVNTILDADFIATTAGSSGTVGGSTDTRGALKKFRLAEPVLAKEFDSNRSYTFMGPTGLPVTVTGDDKTYYIVAKEASETELGALLYNLRQPFSMHTYSGENGAEGVDAVLGRSQDLEWHYDGYMSVNPGHPYTIFKFRGS
jgi:hypothetical protein